VPVLTFAATGTGNCVNVRGTAYVYARTERGEFVLPAQCPHRGGPLHLASFDDSRSRLVCPWHGRKTSVSRHLRSGIPAVRRGLTITAVFPSAAPTPHTLEHRALSADLSHHP
jgi:hypothetical protein